MPARKVCLSVRWLKMFAWPLLLLLKKSGFCDCTSARMSVTSPNKYLLSCDLCVFPSIDWGIQYHYYCACVQILDSQYIQILEKSTDFIQHIFNMRKSKIATSSRLLFYRLLASMIFHSTSLVSEKTKNQTENISINEHCCKTKRGN